MAYSTDYGSPPPGATTANWPPRNSSSYLPDLPDQPYSVSRKDCDTVEHPKVGAKYDEIKVPLFYNPPEIQRGMARAFGYGAGKYGRWNWMGGLAVSRLLAACLRHLLAWFWEETLDPESGLSHLDHAAASLAMLMETVVRRSDLDDRPPALNPGSDNPGLHVEAGPGKS